MKKIFTIFVICLSFFIPKNAEAWDTDNTHPYITLNALNKASNLNGFLENFGLTAEKFDSQDSRDFGSYGAKGWILLGSIWEDFGPDHTTVSLSKVGYRRFLNHYYDPLTKKGLDTIGSTYDGSSSPIWGKTGDGKDGPNQWSWNRARYYFFNALTNGDKVERNKNFALTFRSIGQVLHLLEDTSQPSHVRNDPHVSPSDSWRGSKIFNSSRLEEWGKLNARTVNVSGAATQFLQSFDAYFNELAFFTNTNFFSDDTIFKNYALPSADQTDIGRFIFLDHLTTVRDREGGQYTSC